MSTFLKNKRVRYTAFGRWVNTAEGNVFCWRKFFWKTDLIIIM